MSAANKKKKIKSVVIQFFPTEINRHGEIMPRQRIEPETPGLQIRCYSFYAPHLTIL